MAKARAPSKFRLASDPKKKVKTPASLWSQQAEDGSREASPHHGHKGHSQSSEKQINDFVNYERDWRSHAVKEFDAHQEAARKSHKEELREVMKKAG
jgi:hypothetical protein